MLARYRTRVVLMRLSYTQPRTLEVVGLFLGAVGAWQVVAFGLALLPDAWLGVPSGLIIAPTVAAVALGLLIRLGRHPEQIFRHAAANEASARRLARSLAAGMRYDPAYQLLSDLYADLVTELDTEVGDHIDIDVPRDAQGRRSLVIGLGAPAGAALDEVLARLNTKAPAWNKHAEQFAGERQMFMETLRSGSGYANRFGDEEGENLALERLRIDPSVGLRIDAVKATYGEIVRTSDALINEFALFAHLLEFRPVRGRRAPLALTAPQVLRVLPWRSHHHRRNPGIGILLAPYERAAGIGVAAALLLADEDARDRTVALVKRRSREVGTYPEAMHVIPAGMINVRSGDVVARPGLVSGLPRLTILAELLEECFDLTEFEGHRLANVQRAVESELEARGLADVALHFTGVAIDLLNLRYEICTAVDMSRHAAVVDTFTTSWEYTHHGQLHRVPLDGARTWERGEWVQAGIGCLFLAERWLRAGASDSGEV